MIVSDIHENALNTGKDNIQKNNLSDRIEARLGEWLKCFNR